MTDDEKRLIKETMLSDLEELKKDILLLKETTKPISPDNAIGRLTRLEQVLKIIDEPEFGICEECDKPIPLGRMQLVPESTRCVGCIEGR